MLYLKWCLEMKNPSVLHGQKGMFLHNMHAAYTFHLPIARRFNNELAASRSSGSRIIVILTFPVSQWFFKDFFPSYSGGTAQDFHLFPYYAGNNTGHLLLLY